MRGEITAYEMDEAIKRECAVITYTHALRRAAELPTQMPTCVSRTCSVLSPIR